MQPLLILLLALCCISAVSAAQPAKKEHDMDEGMTGGTGSASGHIEFLTGMISRKRRQLNMGMSEGFASWFKDVDFNKLW